MIKEVLNLLRQHEFTLTQASKPDRAEFICKSMIVGVVKLDYSSDLHRPMHRVHAFGGRILGNTDEPERAAHYLVAEAKRRGLVLTRGGSATRSEEAARQREIAKLREDAEEEARRKRAEVAEEARRSRRRGDSGGFGSAGWISSMTAGGAFD